VEEAEHFVKTKRAELEDPANATDASRLVSAQAALDAAQQALDALYARWAELEKKNGEAAFLTISTAKSPVL
jgi:ABC transport system ATP-binding/permease protein